MRRWVAWAAGAAGVFLLLLLVLDFTRRKEGGDRLLQRLRAALAEVVHQTEEHLWRRAELLRAVVRSQDATTSLEGHPFHVLVWKGEGGFEVAPPLPVEQAERYRQWAVAHERETAWILPAWMDRERGELFVGVKALLPRQEQGPLSCYARLRTQELVDLWDRLSRQLGLQLRVIHPREGLVYASKDILAEAAVGSTELPPQLSPDRGIRLIRGGQGKASWAAGMTHSGLGLAFWVHEGGEEEGTLPLIPAAAATALVTLVFFGLMLWDRRLLARGLARVQALVRDISQRRLIENFPRPTEAALKPLHQALQDLYQQHFLARGSILSNEAYFERLIEHSADFLILVGLGGKIHYLSKSLLRALRLEASSWLGQPVEELLRLPRGEWKSIADQVIEQGGVVPKRFSLNQDGTPMILDARLSVIPGTMDLEPMIVINARDISEEDRLARALARKERLASLGQFSSGIAHEFSNLLTGILGYLSLVQIKVERGETDVLPELQSVQREIVRARELINSLIALSQGGIYRFENFEVGEVVRRAWQDFPHKGRVHFHLHEGPNLKAYGDPQKFRAVLEEIYNNAVYFMSSQGLISVQVGMDHRSPPHSPAEHQEWVKVVVLDNGPGIPADQLGRVFDPFVSTRGEGRGLGLTMVHAVMEAMGGWVEIQSRRGLGTSVSLFLRRAVERGR